MIALSALLLFARGFLTTNPLSGWFMAEINMTSIPIAKGAKQVLLG
jgi:hypothetical protein